MEYSVEHWEDRFFVLCNDEAVNFKLMQAPVSSPGKADWQEVLPHRQSVRLESIEVFAGHLVVKQREQGLQALRVFGLPDFAEHEIGFDEAVYALCFGANPEFDSSELRFGYESMVTPPSVYDYDMNSRERELKKQVEVLGGFDPEEYVAERIFATASDGVEVPISLVRRKDAVAAAPSPLLLYGYGSYGSTTDPTFSSVRLSLLDRGCTFAIAHIRGSGDLGRPWYEDGKLLRKRNTFTDFIACAEHLIEQGYTATERLAIYGGSAGGLLMGAVTNMRPDLFGAVVAKVPFVDVVNTMLDETIPLTVIEWEEWGNPKEREYHDYMASYCPYDNVDEKDYPALLVTTGLNDPRVAYWEPAKWVARLRARKTDSSLLLLKTDLGAGHGGASGRYDKLHEFAFDYAFILRQLGVKSRFDSPRKRRTGMNQNEI